MNNLPIEPNVECRIKSLKGEQALTDRLIQMGILPGSLLKIIRLGPLDETVEIAVDEGESIALRKEELASLDCELVAIPLSAVTAHGVKYRIRSFLGGQVFRQKMKERGLSEGSIIHLQQGPGFQVVNPQNLTTTLGRGEAEKIIVEPVEKMANTGKNNPIHSFHINIGKITLFNSLNGSHRSVAGPLATSHYFRFASYRSIRDGSHVDISRKRQGCE